jgi:hypothetical protein
VLITEPGKMRRARSVRVQHRRTQNGRALEIVHEQASNNNRGRGVAARKGDRQGNHFKKSEDCGGEIGHRQN